LGNSLAGWRRSFVTDGVILTPREGPGAGVIRIRTREAPLRSVRAIADGLVGRLTRKGASVTVAAPIATHTLFPVYVAVLVWGGLALRDPRLVALLLGRPTAIAP